VAAGTAALQTAALPDALPGFEREWRGAQGLAEDVRYYGRWMRDEAEKRIGHLYPKIEITKEMVDGTAGVPPARPDPAGTAGVSPARPELAGTAGILPARPDLKPYLGRKLTVIAWLWARTVKSPNPAFADVDVPLVSTFMLSTKPGKEAYVEPVLVAQGARASGTRASCPHDARQSGKSHAPPGPRASSPQSSHQADEAPVTPGTRASSPQIAQRSGGTPDFSGTPGTRSSSPQDERTAGGTSLLPGYHFTVKIGKPKDLKAAENGTKLARGANFKCLMSGMPIEGGYIKAEGKAGRMGARLMAIVAEGDRGRIYLPPTPEHEAAARNAKPLWKPETSLPDDPRNFWTVQYGLANYGDLFTPRQIVALTTFSDLVQEAIERVKLDALAAGMNADGKFLHDGGNGATAYAEAVGVYLGLAVSSLSDRMTTICTWDAGGPTWGTKTRNTFARQAIPMSWDFAEVNPLSTQSGSFENSLDYTSKGVVCTGTTRGIALQADAAAQTMSIDKIVSTDPPYYDNIGYADLSDFFYIWLRLSLNIVYNDIFCTLAVPKAEELVATPYRHGNKENAEIYFLDGMTHAMHRLSEQTHPAFPVTIYYAFKQTETESDEKGETASTGWDTFLEAVISANFAISGTWPMRTELGNRMIGKNTNALASSIILVCRPRDFNAPITTRREFITAFKEELPLALANLQHGNIAPVDLAQSAIGPGMAVYTRYAKVLDAEGKKVSVRDALALINQTLDEVLAEQEGDFDAASRWALAWFEQNGFSEGEYGVAETLSKAKNTSVKGLVDAGILKSGRGKVRLLKPNELDVDWDPEKDSRPTAWQIVHHLIRLLESGGEEAAAKMVPKLGNKAESARDLCYRLYTLCERKKRAAEALSYNALVQSWPEILRISRAGLEPAKKVKKAQADLFDDDKE
jgi:putative DNA methylase